jgi:hypothetical protein
MIIKLISSRSRLQNHFFKLFILSLHFDNQSKFVNKLLVCQFDLRAFTANRFFPQSWNRALNFQVKSPTFPHHARLIGAALDTQFCLKLRAAKVYVIWIGRLCG